MSVLNNNNSSSSSDDVVECPLCMEPLEVDDLNFYPCTCGYQICRFCWHRIRTDENELCPACRKAYPENPADFTPLSQEQIAALKAEKRQRDQQRKQKITENRKHLANVRVVQKNLVFVVGLPPRLADADILKKHEYFGKYGKIHKVVINPSTTYAGVQGPSASAYVTYVHNNDALRAIQCVNNIMIDGRLIKTSLGTTKYCSHFMKNQQCPKADCMYLHELGDSEASFTKEEMHQGKHQEYEKRLHDALIAEKGSITTTTATTTNNKNGDKLVNGTGSGGTGNNKEAWPSLSVSPVQKEPIIKMNGKGGNKEITATTTSKGDNRKHDKAKSEKKNGQKNNNKIQNNNSTNHNNNSSNYHNQNEMVTTNDKHNEQEHRSNAAGNKQQQNKSINHNLNVDDELTLIEDFEKDGTSSEDSDGKNMDTQSISNSSSSSSNNGSSSSDSVSTLSESTSGKSSPGSFPDDHHLMSPATATKAKDTRAAATTTTTLESNNIQTTTKTQTTTKSSLDSNCGGTTTTTTAAAAANHETAAGTISNLVPTSCLSKLSLYDDNSSFFSSTSSSTTPPSCTTSSTMLKGKLVDNDCRTTTMNNQLNNTVSSHLPDLLNGIDEYQNHHHNHTSTLLNGIGGGSGSSNSNSSGIGVGCGIQNLIDNPEKYLLSSLNHHPTTNEDWEVALKYVILRSTTNKQQQITTTATDDHHHHHHHEDYLRMQELQKRNNLINSIGVSSSSQMNGSGLHDFSGNDFMHNSGGGPGNDLNRISQQTTLFQQQQQQQRQQLNGLLNQNDHHMMGSSLFGTNMSKFFDFHKSQQQQHHQNQHQYMTNGHNNSLISDHRDHLSMATLLENNRINSQYLDHTNSLIGQQLQKQRIINNKYDQMGTQHNQMLINNNSNSNSNQQLQQQQQQQQQQLQQQQQQQNRIPKQFVQSSSNVDDDLGFDPFMETQKALAELMENELVQQQTTAAATAAAAAAASVAATAAVTQNGHNNKQYHLENSIHQRTRMPPPGFNHMNAFGFGVPRPQGSSKILPFMNNGSQQQQPHQQQQQTLPQQNGWPQHLGGGGAGNGFQQPPPQSQHQQQLNDQLVHMGQPNHNGGGSSHHKTGYGNMPDWTAMDPAILSFRQFPTYSSHHQQPQQHTAPDMFMQHLTQQQQQQQQNQGFGHHAALPNNILNQQQNSPAQVNYSNWFNSDQNLYMNNVTNGFSNNYDKFSIPMPPGIHTNSSNNCITTGNRQQKTELIN